MPEKKNSIIYPLSMIAAGAGLVLLSRKFLQPRLNLEDQVVFITGGSRGLGLAMAEEYARHGARLVICARDERELARAEAMLSEMGVKVMALGCDLTDRSQVLHTVQEVMASFGRIDILVNNAGIISAGPLRTLSIEDFEMSMDNI